MKTTKKKKVETRWVVECEDSSFMGSSMYTFLDIGEAMDFVYALHGNGLPMSKIALYKAVRVVLPK